MLSVFGAVGFTDIYERNLNHPNYLVELWCGRASVSEPGSLEAYCEAAMCEEELRQALRYKRLTTRNQHVVGRGMARTLLAGPGTAPQEIVFSFNRHGKPDVMDPTVAKRPFNLAHTEGLVVFAATETGCIGVDVEKLSRKTDIAIANRYFASPEVDYVMSHARDEDRRLAFLKVWTLKESFIKAVGRGLSIPLADFAFEEVDSAAPKIRLFRNDLGDGAAWHFACVSPAEGYIASVAVSDLDDVELLDVRVRDFHSMLPASANEA